MLIADFFFVCAALAWLVAGVGVNAALNNSVILEPMLGLYVLVTQPLKLLSEVRQQARGMVAAEQALLDAWYPLWQWVFQPAIGVLMLGAVSFLLQP